MAAKDDFLSLDSELGEKRKQMEQSEREKAKLFYEAFVRSPAGKAVLEQWTHYARTMRVAVNASVQEYAAAEAIRAFIEKIHANIELANKPG